MTDVELEKVKSLMVDALLALGNPEGQCKINTCPGCQYERVDAIHLIREALTIWTICGEEIPQWANDVS